MSSYVKKLWQSYHVNTVTMAQGSDEQKGYSSTGLNMHML